MPPFFLEYIHFGAEGVSVFTESRVVEVEHMALAVFANYAQIHRFLE